MTFHLKALSSIREDISLTLKDNVLVIAALKPQTGEEEHGVYFQKERNFGRFYRRVPHTTIITWIM